MITLILFFQGDEDFSVSWATGDEWRVTEAWSVVLCQLTHGWWLESNGSVIICELSTMITHIYKPSSYWRCYSLPLIMSIILQPTNISIQWYNQHWIFRLILNHKCLEMIHILIKLIQIVLRKFVFLLNRQTYFDSQSVALDFDT